MSGSPPQEHIVPLQCMACGASLMSDVPSSSLDKPQCEWTSNDLLPQASSLRSELHKLRSYIQCLDTELGSLESSLVHLLHRREKAQKQLHGYKGLTIRSLPLELLSEIFLRCTLEERARQVLAWPLCFSLRYVGDGGTSRYPLRNCGGS